MKFWKDYVWKCPWGHWIADFAMCRSCWNRGDHRCEEWRAAERYEFGERAVHVWHNVYLEASCNEDHELWKFLQVTEPIREFMCLHRKNFEIQSPGENLRTRIVKGPA